MPTYEYRCPEGHEFEKFQRMSDPPESDCPECGSAAQRIMSGGAGLLFKGEGFYITDYRSDSYRKAADKDTKGAAADSKGESKGDSKSDKKAKSEPSSSSSSSSSPDKKTGSKE